MSFKGWPELTWFNRLVGSGYRFPYSLKDAFDVMYQCRRVKWFFQRGWRGWSDRDTWSLDTYLESWLPEAIRHLAKHTHGAPAELFSEDESKWEEGHKKWSEILESIASGIEASKHANMDCECPWETHEDIHRHEEEWRPKFEEGKQLLVKWWSALWD